MKKTALQSRYTIYVILFTALLMIFCTFPQLVSAKLLYTYEQNFDNFTFTPKTEFNDQTARWTMNFSEGNSGSGVTVTDSGELSLKSGVIPSTGLATIRFVPKRDTTNPLTGTVEIEFDIRLEGGTESLNGMYTDYYFLSIQDQTTTDVGYLTIYGDELFLGKPAEACIESGSQKANAIVAENLFEKTDGVTIKVVVDFDEGTYTAFCDGQQAKYYPATSWDTERNGDYSGVATKKLLRDTATSLGRMIFGLSFKGYNGSASSEGIVNYFDNLKVTQFVKPTYTVNVSDSDTGVSVYDSFNFYFSETMDTESLSNIKLFKGKSATGNEISVDRLFTTETGYSIIPAEPLDYYSEYTLSIPDTVKSSTFGNVFSEEITFMTQHETDEYYVHENFSGIDDANVEFELSDKFDLTGSAVDGGSLSVNNGRLSLDAGTTYKMQFSSVNEGAVTVGFDYTVPEDYAGEIFSIGDGTNNITASAYAGTLNFAGDGKSDILKSGINHFEFTVDYTGETPKVIMDFGDGMWNISEDFDGDFSELNFFNGSTSETIYIDNLLIHKKLSPTVTFNVNNGDTDADPDDKLVLTFNTPISESNAEKIGFYENGVLIDGALYELSDNGKVLTFTEPMKYSMPYKLVIGDGLVADNALTLSAQTVSFYAMHKPSDVLVNDISFIDANGTSVESMAERNNVNVSVSYQNTLSAKTNIILVCAFYRNGEMTDIEYINIPVQANEINSAEHTIVLPEDKSGLALRVFGWDSYTKMNSLISAAILSE